jgi:hypothetical protein
VLYWAYVGLFVLLFLNKDFYLAQNYFTFVVGPLALIPIQLDSRKTYLLTRIPQVKFSLENTRATLSHSGTKIFFCLTIFAGTIALMSWLTPTPTSGWFWPMLNYFLSILLFLLVTARLSNFMPDFHVKFLTVLSVIGAANAAVNIYFYVKNDDVRILPPTRDEEKDERWHSFEAAGFRNGMDYNLFGFKPSQTNHWRWEESRAKGILRRSSDFF